MGNAKVDKGSSSRTTRNFIEGCYSIMIVSQERGKMDEDAGLFSTCTSYPQSPADDTELSDG